MDVSNKNIVVKIRIERKWVDRIMKKMQSKLARPSFTSVSFYFEHNQETNASILLLIVFVSLYLNFVIEPV